MDTPVTTIFHAKSLARDFNFIFKPFQFKL
jgi:hypothetical protein